VLFRDKFFALCYTSSERPSERSDEQPVDPPRSLSSKTFSGDSRTMGSTWILREKIDILFSDVSFYGTHTRFCIEGFSFCKESREWSFRRVFVAASPLVIKFILSFQSPTFRFRHFFMLPKVRHQVYRRLKYYQKY
jgi:hypothetical protein